MQGNNLSQMVGVDFIRFVVRNKSCFLYFSGEKLPGFYIKSVTISIIVRLRYGKFIPQILGLLVHGNKVCTKLSHIMCA